MELFKSLLNDEAAKIIDAITMLVPGILVGVVFFTTIVIIRKVQKSQMSIEDSVSWIIWNLIFIVLMGLLLWEPSKQVLTSIAEAMGIDSPILVVVLWVVIFMFGKIVSLNIKISKTNTKLTQTIQELAAFKHEIEKENMTERIFRNDR